MAAVAAAACMQCQGLSIWPCQAKQARSWKHPQYNCIHRLGDQPSRARVATGSTCTKGKEHNVGLRGWAIDSPCKG